VSSIDTTCQKVTIEYLQKKQKSKETYREKNWQHYWWSRTGCPL